MHIYLTFKDKGDNIKTLAVDDYKVREMVILQRKSGWNLIRKSENDD